MTQYTVKSCIRNFWINVINKYSISMLTQNILKLTTRLLAIFDCTVQSHEVCGMVPDLTG